MLTKQFYRALVILCTSLTMSHPALSDSNKSVNQEAPRNIIYLIGDGMGPAYTSAYRYFNDDPATKAVEPTIFDQLLVGMASTYPDDDTYVTDSAAAATALATGHKSYNGAIAVDHNHNKLDTLMEEAKRQGMATAIVVTSQINHATPASFLAHNESRRNYNQIADDYLNNLIAGKPVADLMFGGGQQYFVRLDRDLTAEFTELGYQYTDSLSELEKITRLPSLGLFAPSGMPNALDSQDPLRLNTMTDKALSLLTMQDKPFVLMVEASQIDWCGHANDITCAMYEMQDFAHTLTQVKQYVDRHPDTLLITTADHSTGGLTLGSKGKYQWQGQRLKQIKSSPNAFASQLLNTPDSLTSTESFSSILQQHFGLALNAEAAATLRLKLLAQLKSEKPERELTKVLKTSIDDLTHTGWTTTGHDAIDVQVFAYGKGQHRFSGMQDNTEIARKLIDMIKAQTSPTH